MRWLCRTVTAIALVATFAPGCGSTAGSSLILRFVRWNNTGITQQDAVRENSADVDALQDCCRLNLNGSCASFEPFTQTTINAVFRNQQASDIRLEGYTVHVDDTASGLGDTAGSLAATITGGRCSSLDKQCTDDSDCVTQGAGGAVASTCNHTETTVSGIVLFDFASKLLVSHNIFGFQTSVTVTFFGSDPNQTFATSARYLVTFADFDHCTTTTGTGGA